MKRHMEGKVIITAAEPITALAAYMEAVGLKQRDLAEAIGVTRFTVSSVAKGEDHHRSTSERLASYTGLNDDLIYAGHCRDRWCFLVNGHRVTLLTEDTDGASAAA